MGPKDQNLMDIMTKPSDVQKNMINLNPFSSTAPKQGSSPALVSNPIDREKSNQKMDESMKTPEKSMKSSCAHDQVQSSASKNGSTWVNRRLIPDSQIQTTIQSPAQPISTFYGLREKSIKKEVDSSLVKKQKQSPLDDNDGGPNVGNGAKASVSYPWEMPVGRLFTMGNGIVVNLPKPISITFSREFIRLDAANPNEEQNVISVNITHGIFMATIIPFRNPLLLLKYHFSIPKALVDYMEKPSDDVCLVIELLPDQISSSEQVPKLLSSAFVDIGIFENDNSSLFLELAKLEHTEIYGCDKFASFLASKLPGPMYQHHAIRSSQRLSKSSKLSYRALENEYDAMPIFKKTRSNDDCIMLDDGSDIHLDTLRERDHTELFTYPFEGGPSITILVEDQNRLGPQQYLNDNIVDFYLMYLMDTFPNDSIHIMNSFFFTFLSRKDRKRSVGAIDPFERDFLIVPIHSGIHWYLTIILWPRTLLEESNYKREAVISSGDESEFLSTQEGALSSESRHRCTIVVFDSLVLMRRKRVQDVKDLRQYLASELAERYNIVLKDFNHEIPHIIAKVPSQKNAFDCGIYLLHYVEKFISDPDGVSQRLVKKEDMKDWFTDDEVNEKRENIRELVKKLSKEYSEYKENNPEPRYESEDDVLMISTKEDTPTIHLIDCNK